jgi:hypothetical protein
MKTRVIAAAGTLGLAAALFPMVSASAATDKVLVCHHDEDGFSLLSLPSAAVKKQGHGNHPDTIEGSTIDGRTITAADVRAACGESGPTPSTVTVTATVTNNVPGPTVTDTVTSTVTNNVPGPTVTDTMTVPGPGVTTTLPGQTITLPAETITLPGETVTLPAKTVTLPGETVTLPGETVTLPGKAVPGPVSTVTVKAAASTVTKTAAAAGVAAAEDGPSKRLAYTGTSAWEPVGLGAGLLLAGLLLLLGRRTLATERRH